MPEHAGLGNTIDDAVELRTTRFEQLGHEGDGRRHVPQLAGRRVPVVGVPLERHGGRHRPGRLVGPRQFVEELLLREATRTDTLGDRSIRSEGDLGLARSENHGLHEPHATAGRLVLLEAERGTSDRVGAVEQLEVQPTFGDHDVASVGDGEEGERVAHLDRGPLRGERGSGATRSSGTGIGVMARSQEGEHAREQEVLHDL